MQSTVAARQSAVQSSQPNPLWLTGLVLLDAFVLGGVLAIVLVRDLLVTILYRLVTGEAQGEILNVLDHMLPYQVAFWGVALVLTVLTSIGLGFGTNSWRIAVLPIVALLALVVIGFVI